MRALLASDAPHIRAARFIGVGGASTSVYWIVILVVAGYGRFNPTAASIIAYAAGFAVAYVGHRYFTYRSDAPVGIELRRFLTVHAVCFTIGNLGFWYVVSQMKGNLLLGGAVLTATSFAITYVASEFWVFQFQHTHEKN